MPLGKVNNRVFHFSIFVSLLLLAGSALAQSGSIKGVVYDSDPVSDPLGATTLPGANVYLQSSITTGTVSDVDGTFLLTGAPVGPQVLVISYAGFETQEIPIEVVEGNPVNVDVTLGSQAIQGVEVVVTGQALGQAKAINQQLSSDAIANFVSGDKMKELPDVNAAEAISRLPGVAINRSGGEGSKVVVRGLDPKFTAISINGVRLPSTSGTDRSVDLSLISPELLSGIELFKSPTPDMDGDALGGAINLNIIRAPKDRKIVVKGLGGYNDIRGTFSDYKGTVSFSDRFLDDKVGITATGNVERFNRGGETISQSWGNDLGTVIDTAQDIFRQQGNSLQYTYREEQRYRQNGSVGVDFELGERTDVTVLGIFSRTSRDRYEQNERYDVGNTRIVYSPNIIESSIELWSGSVSTRHAFDAFSVEWGAAYSTIRGKTPTDLNLDFWSTGIPFDAAVQTDGSRDNPQSFDRFVSVDPLNSYFQGASSESSANSEDIRSAFLNLDVPLKLGTNLSANLKVGGKVNLSQRQRDYDATRDFNFYLRPNTDFEALGSVAATASQDDGSNYYSLLNFTQPGELNVDRADGSEASLLANFRESQVRRYFDLFGDALVENRYQDVNNYALDENVYATYAMLKLSVGKKLTLIPGVRFERSDNTYTGLYADLNGEFGTNGTQREETVDRDYGNLLPHLHAKYQATEWLDVRASYSTTLARPDFDYVVPTTLVNRSSNLVITKGNPELEASVSTNYDLYLTAYKGSWGLFSVGVFQKDIKDAFYPFVVGLNTPELVAEYGFPESGFGNALLTTYSNAPESRVRGLEFDAQSNLNWLPKPFDGLVLNLNYSLLSSETIVNSFTEETTIQVVNGRPVRRVVVAPFQRDVDLVGQAPQIFNASLGYDRGPFSARASVSYQGSKLSGYASSVADDRYNLSFWRMDAVVKYKFTDDFNAFVNLNNLTNQQDINYFRDENFVTSISTFGTTATVGAQYTFR